jgi:hypothetical protein
LWPAIVLDLELASRLWMMVSAQATLAENALDSETVISDDFADFSDC